MRSRSGERMQPPMPGVAVAEQPRGVGCIRKGTAARASRVPPYRVQRMSGSARNAACAASYFSRDGQVKLSATET